MNIFLRYGSHSEKDYFDKILRFFDGVTFSGNLIEMTPNAVASLIIKHCKENNRDYLIDPMTYSFGEYYSHDGQLISDLQWLKSKTKKGFEIKASYKKLALKLGNSFSDAVENSKAITLKDLDGDIKRKDICKSVIEYQNNRIKNILREDEETASFANDLSMPKIIFTPYFFIDKKRKDLWINIYQKIRQDSLSYSNDLYLSLCFDYDLLLDSNFINAILKLGNGFKGVYLWINDFDESERSANYLSSFRRLVEKYKENGLEVFNRHGGYFSYLLSKFGMTSVSHGVGYGSKKNIMPVLGGGTPVINYYFPPLHGKFGIPEIELLFENLHINTHHDFFQKICDCAICKGVIKDDLNNFKNFGETRSSKSKKSNREVQTPAAAKKARFHFLLCMLKEREEVRKKDIDKLVNQLKEIKGLAESHVIQSKARYINNWIDALAETSTS